MDYLITMESGEKVIAHYGIKGMKWGVWNEETRSRYTNSVGAKRAQASIEDQSKSLIRAVERQMKKPSSTYREVHARREATKLADKEIRYQAKVAKKSGKSPSASERQALEALRAQKSVRNHTIGGTILGLGVVGGVAGNAIGKHRAKNREGLRYREDTINANLSAAEDYVKLGRGQINDVIAKVQNQNRLA